MGKIYEFAQNSKPVEREKDKDDFYAGMKQYFLTLGIQTAEKLGSSYKCSVSMGCTLAFAKWRP
ncbi:hypothetical protein [Paenibacillus cremeus]|uniref:Uncharacterized protein n=1 Tax=Paenibacillus cremeus TaxID=2163881 RepID=A0A559K8G1_9BACL|nr:hypothetical protein [Paenibacillus cremeus]TVY08373.1 hypothetical protein FPZ49_19210 [Paenibacillus cremeus]